MSTYAAHSSRNRGGRVPSALERRLARLAHALDSIDPGPDDDDVDRWAAHDRDMSVTDDEAEEFAAEMRERNARRCVDCEARITTAGRNGTCADCALAQLEGVALADMEAS
jgi:hypothetical protein